MAGEMRLVYACLLWIAGLLFCAACGLSAGLGFVLLALCVVFACFGDTPQRRAALCFAVFAAGLLRYALQPAGPGANDIASLNGTRRITVEGLVCEEPDRRSTRSQLVLEIERVLLNGEWQPMGGRALLTTPLYPRYEYGDRLAIRGSLEEPPEDGSFSYKRYLADRGIYTLVSGEITLMAEQPGVYRWMLDAKQTLRRLLERLLPDPESGLLAGILLGLDHTLPDHIQQAFRSAGLSHIIVISGFNISLVAQALMAASARMGKSTGLWVALLGILMFAAFVGWSPPVTRAAIMGALTILAQLAGRKSHTPTSLAAATLLMTVLSPRMLWNVSFQLSLAASAGLIFIEPVIANRIALKGNAFSLMRELVLSTLVAQLMTLPVAWYHFGELSLFALPANILVLWAQPVILAVGACAVVLGLLWLPLGQLAAALVWPLLRYTNQVVVGVSQIDGALLELPRLSLWGACGIYGAIGLLALFWQRSGAPGVSMSSGQLVPRQALVAGLVGLMLVSMTSRLPDGNTHIYFFDVGQGDASLIVSPGGRTILIDGGADPALLATRIGETLPFWQRHIDCVVATHADGDHLTGLAPLAERYDIGLALESPVMKPSPLVQGWHEALREQGTTLIMAQAGQRLTVGAGLTMSIAHPALHSPKSGWDDNRYSVVAVVDAGKRLLFAADMDIVAEDMLLAANADLDADILKVAHHGADTSSSSLFLEAVSPELAIISVGADSRYGHPTDGCLEKLAAVNSTIMRTDRDGTIEIIITPPRVANSDRTAR